MKARAAQGAQAEAEQGEQRNGRAAVQKQQRLHGLDCELIPLPPSAISGDRPSFLRSGLTWRAATIIFAG
jgi:hypothetical protein